MYQAFDQKLSTRLMKPGHGALVHVRPLLSHPTPKPTQRFVRPAAEAAAAMAQVTKKSRAGKTDPFGTVSVADV